MRAHATAEPSETFARGVARDPYPMYEVLRDAGPVVWSDDVLGGAWLLTRYADIVTALQDPRLSAARADAFAQQFDGARQRQLTPFTEAFGRWLLFMDAPHHSRLRKALNYGFKPAVLEALRPRIERLVDELLLPLLSPDMNPDSGNPPRDSTAELLGGSRSAEIPGADPVGHDGLDHAAPDPLGPIQLAQVVEHHRRREHLC